MSSTTRPEDSDVVAGHDDNERGDAAATHEHDDQRHVVRSPVLEDDGDGGYIAPLRRDAPRAPSARLQRPAGRPATRRPRGHRATWRARLLVMVAAAALVLTVIAVISLNSDDSKTQPAGAVGARAATPASDAAVSAFAVQFARAFLTYSPQHPDYHAAAVRPFLAPTLRSSDPLRVPRHGPNQTVTTVAVADIKTISRSRSLVSVAATVVNDTITTRYLTVPVARDATGGVIVDDYPAFAAAPPQARVDVTPAAPLAGPQAGAIRDLLQTFFADYLNGHKPRGLAASAHVTALAQRYRLQHLRVAQLAGDDAPKRTVLVTVRARDRQTDARYTMRYRATVVRRGRWYVQSLQDGQAP